MDSTLRLRLATIEDSAALARVQVDSYRAAYAGILPQDFLDHFTYEEQAQDWRDLFSARPQDILFVAETGAGKVIGYALGRAGASGIPPYDGELVSLHVRRSHQRQGIGRRLVAVFAQELQQRGCSSLMLWVLVGNPARGFYERLGGQSLGREKTMRYWNGDPAIEVAYGWPDVGILCHDDWDCSRCRRPNPQALWPTFDSQEQHEPISFLRRHRPRYTE